jgi:signal transduction histidine kinase
VRGVQGRSANRRSHGVSLVAVAVFVVVAVASVIGFALLQRSVNDQNRSLLREDAQKAGSVLQGLVANIGGTVHAVGALATASGGTIGPSTDAEIAKLATGFSVALVAPTPSGYRVTYAKGPAYTAGQLVAGPVAAAVASSTAQLSETKVFTVGGHPTLALVEGPANGGIGAVVVQFPLNPYASAKSGAEGPFANLAGAVYATRGQDPSQVILATTFTVPVTGTTASVPVTYQNVHWWVVAMSRPGVNPSGTLTDVYPYLVLALGLFVGLLVAVTAEILVRRQRYAAEQVALRTRELETSLDHLQEAQAALVRSERLSAIGEMASVVGHELRNPLTAVTNSHFLLRQSLGDPAPAPVEKHLAMAERETAKAAALAEDLTAFVRPREPVFGPVRLDEVVQEVLEATPPPDGVAVSVESDDGMIDADRGQIAEVLVNLVTNAYQAVPDGGEVRVTALSSNGTASLVVSDTGEGVDPTMAGRMFEPFFTTKANGTGLGLAIVRRLVEAHGGEVAFENVDPRGARVTVRLPLRHEAAG